MTTTFSTCHVCQIPVNQCVTESQNNFTNINVENITERDTNSPNRLQPGFRRSRPGLHGPWSMEAWVILERSQICIPDSDSCKEQFSRSKLEALRKNPCFCPKPGKQNLVSFLNCRSNNRLINWFLVLYSLIRYRLSSAFVTYSYFIY